jgi:hypothetical protein
VAEFGGGGVLGGLAGVFTGLASAIRAFAGITAKQLLDYLAKLRQHLLELSQAVYKGIKETAKALARSVLAIARGFRDGLRSFASWARRHLEALHTFLKDKLGPVLRFLDKVRKKWAELYAKYVRPVLDVIDFIRQLNAVLEVFHIRVLSGLDATLAAVERKIDSVYQTVLANINRIDNFLDRVIGLDGLYQRFTLMASMSRYRGPWIAGFWNGQIDAATIAVKLNARPDPEPVEDPALGGAELAKFYQGQSADIDDAMPELLELFRTAAGAGR